MIARLSRYKIKSEHIADVTAQIPAIKQALAQVEEMVIHYAAWTDEGDALVFVVYNTMEDAEAGLEKAGGIWTSLAPYLEGPPEVSTFENAESMR